MSPQGEKTPGAGIRLRSVSAESGILGHRQGASHPHKPYTVENCEGPLNIWAVLMPTLESSINPSFTATIDPGQEAAGKNPAAKAASQSPACSHAVIYGEYTRDTARVMCKHGQACSSTRRSTIFT